MHARRTNPLLEALTLACLIAGLMTSRVGAGAEQEMTPADSDITRGVEPMESVRDARFRFLDLDGNGFIAPREVDSDQAVLRSQFDSLDADGDGRLSEDEFVKFTNPR